MSMLNKWLFSLGIARTLDDVENSELCNVAGTFFYMAPEVGANLVKTCNYDSKIDMWSIGVLLYQCLTGQVYHSLIHFTSLPFINNVFRFHLTNAVCASYSSTRPVTISMLTIHQNCLKRRTHRWPISFMLCSRSTTTEDALQSSSTNKLLNIANSNKCLLLSADSPCRYSLFWRRRWLTCPFHISRPIHLFNQSVMWSDLTSSFLIVISKLVISYHLIMLIIDFLSKRD